MRNLFSKTILLIVLLISPLTIHAHTDAEVTQWVKKILIDTLSVNYTFKQDEEDPLHVNYTANAWNALSQFLGNYIPVIQEEHLTLHPVFSQEPFVQAQGIALGIQYWRVDEVVSVPELNLMIAFSLIVIETNGGLLIQSMDMIKKENS